MVLLRELLGLKPVYIEVIYLYVLKKSLCIEIYENDPQNFMSNLSKNIKNKIKKWFKNLKVINKVRKAYKNLMVTGKCIVYN